jgi:hypothetical protein
VLFVVNAGEIVFRSASQAMLPALVPPTRLERANGWLTGGDTLMENFVAGPLGGFLFVIAAGLPFLVNAGDIVTLEDQDRSRWNRAEIAEGVGLLEAAARRGQHGPYLIQAAIARCHATAHVAGQTNWALIARLYDTLAQLVPSPVIELNRAVAVGMADGPAAGPELVDALAGSGGLASYHLLPATRADLLRRLGQHAEAAASYCKALDLAVNDAERRYLARRLAEVKEKSGPDDGGVRQRRPK